MMVQKPYQRYIEPVASRRIFHICYYESYAFFNTRLLVPSRAHHNATRSQRIPARAATLTQATVQGGLAFSYVVSASSSGRPHIATCFADDIHGCTLFHLVAMK